jgi:hypothetical protein
MAKFMIEMPHTDAECLQALDEISEHSATVLSKASWGCMSGVHNGWAVVDANNEAEVRQLVASPLMQKKARVTKLSTFTRQDIEGFHKMKK